MMMMMTMVVRAQPMPKEYTEEELMSLRYEYTQEITGMLRTCTEVELREARSVAKIDFNVSCSRYMIELVNEDGLCFESEKRTHVSFERKPLKVYYSEIDEGDGGFTILTEDMGANEGRFYARVEYLCEKQTSKARETLTEAIIDEKTGHWILPYNAYLMDDDVLVNGRTYWRYQSMDTWWWNACKYGGCDY